MPSVDGEHIIPRVRIYDAADDGTYWYRGIGFTSKLTEP